MNKNTPTPPKVSNRQKARDLSERLETVEGDLNEIKDSLPTFMFATDRALDVVQNQQSQYTEIQNALVALIGVEQVTAKVAELRIEQETKNAEARKRGVYNALESGKIAPEETVRPCVIDDAQVDPQGNSLVLDEGSIVALVEFDADGKEIPYSYACVPLVKINNLAYREKLAGQKVGFEWEISFEGDATNPPRKGKAVLVGIYKRLPKAAPAVQAVPDLPAQVVAEQAATPAPAQA